jgi:hypothetical protein
MAYVNVPDLAGFAGIGFDSELVAWNTRAEKDKEEER